MGDVLSTHRSYSYVHTFLRPAPNKLNKMGSLFGAVRYLDPVVTS